MILKTHMGNIIPKKNHKIKSQTYNSKRITKSNPKRTHTPKHWNVIPTTVHLLHAEISQIGFARASCRAPDVRPRCCGGQCNGQTQYSTINTPAKQERVRTVEGEENSCSVMHVLFMVSTVLLSLFIILASLPVTCGDDNLLRFLECEGCLWVTLLDSCLI